LCFLFLSFHFISSFFGIPLSAMLFFVIEPGLTDATGPRPAS